MYAIPFTVGPSLLATRNSNASYFFSLQVVLGDSTAVAAARPAFVVSGYAQVVNPTNEWSLPSQGEVVAEQCLTCGNCTQVCPTCFCYTIEDATDLTGQHAERWRKDDSCFTTSFSFISSGSIRTSAKARYRQWLIHKLVASSDQFGLSGCVGCGRCITWCPVGIDITAEAVALRSGGEYEHA